MVRRRGEDDGVSGDAFYGPAQADIHHTAFGDLADGAATRLLAELRDAGHETGTVVDLGCGSGILARRVSDAGYDVVGIDLSAAMVATPRPHARLSGAAVITAPLGARSGTG